ATNVGQSAAEAHVSGASVTTAASGDVTVQADNTATIDATTLNAVTSGGTGVGITLAFNTIGWKPQNLLFNLVDTIIGDPLIAGAFNGEVPSGATAFVHESTLDADGAVLVKATAAASLTSLVQNQTAASSSDFSSANGTSFGIVLSQNKVSSKALAYIDGATSTVDAGAGVEVSAADQATLTARLESAAETSTSAGKFGSGDETAVNVLVATNVVQSAAEAHVSGASVTTAASGDVTVQADNTATIDATTLNAVTSGGTGV